MLRVMLSAIAAIVAAATGVAAEPIKIGVVGVNAFAPIYVAQERGYFAAEGVPAELVYFDAAAPVAVATVSGSIDIGVAAVTAAFYNLAGQGELKIIAAAAHEVPGFHVQVFLVSRKADAAGLKSPKDFPGHSFGLTTAGAPPVYVVGGILAAKYGFDYGTIKVLPLQTIPNIDTALAGGTADFTAVSLLPGMLPLIKRGDVKVMGWVGDLAPWQFGIVFTSTKATEARRDMLDRFLRAYRKGARDYHDAIATPDGKRKEGPEADRMIAILAKYTKQSPEQVKLGVPYVDAEGRLDVKDIENQVRFYKSRGLVKPNIEAGPIIDQRSVIPLPEK
ncbi:MAG TPA: ABC transporter substrate-binding protein [Stellaceae bacterium]|nr:ABC transporter substrate-binding protein [Stellaceae bacterium]